jgi:hypothetical protein
VAEAQAQPGEEARLKEPTTLGGRLKRAGMLATMSVVTLNVYTGSPLLGLWVGSRVQGSGPPSMAAVFVVAGVFGAVAFVLVRVLAWMNPIYNRLTGRPPQVRTHTPWLRSMRGERPREVGPGYKLSALDYILVGSVMLVALAFEVWFFFFSSSPLDGRTGRH